MPTRGLRRARVARVVCGCGVGVCACVRVCVCGDLPQQPQVRRGGAHPRVRSNLKHLVG